jgi:hypothetical protein
MTPRVCLCCGESISEKPNNFSGNPNLCAACKALAEEGQEPTAIKSANRRLSAVAIREVVNQIQNPT